MICLTIQQYILARSRSFDFRCKEDCTFAVDAIRDAMSGLFSTADIFPDVLFMRRIVLKNLIKSFVFLSAAQCVWVKIEILCRTTGLFLVYFRLSLKPKKYGRFKNMKKQYVTGDARLPSLNIRENSCKFTYKLWTVSRWYKQWFILIWLVDPI